MKTSTLEDLRSKLADLYKRTAKVPTSVWSSVCQVELDQIYTRLSFVKKEKIPTGTVQSNLTDYSELFTSNKKGIVPKRILVQGETGIGKSTFVKKVALDWAKLVDDKDVVNEEMAASSNCQGGKKPSRKDHVGVSQAESSEARKHDDSSECHIDALKKFQLVITVPLKYVSKCQSFSDVLSCSRLIPKDEESLIDDLFTYVCNNQEKVLLVFDGYDEYRTGSVAEAQFGTRSTSPICEIFHRNELRDCTVLVTTRSSRADELQESADKHAKITGFCLEDQFAFMKRMLGSNSQVSELKMFLLEKSLFYLARVPLLNLFFCLLFRQDKEKMMELGKRKTPFYRAIIRYILQYSNKRLSPAKVYKVKEEDYQEILTEIGKVALESLLKGSQVFEYGQLSEKVRGEESVMVGLLQLSENDASLEPTEIVSFIHKSIQEYLAAWFIANRCVPEGNLGGIEKRAATLEDCKAIANILQFVCGLSTEGAVKVLTHLSTVRANDSSVDFSKLMPVDETETDLPWADFTPRHSQFNDLVRDCFQEVSLAPDLIEHVFGCTGGIIVQETPVDRGLVLKPEVLTQQATHSWAFYFINRIPERQHLRWPFSTVNSVENLYQSVQFLDLLHIPLRMVRNSKELKLGDFLAKFRLCSCTFCTFASVLCCADGKMMVYITDLNLMCDKHTSMFTEAAAVVSDQSVSAKMCSSQPCLKFLTSLSCIFHGNRELLRELVVMVRNCEHLQGIRYGGDGDYVVDFLEELAFPGKLFLTIIVKEEESVWSVVEDFPCFPYTAPRREESLCLIANLLCLYSFETAMAFVGSISPESLGEVSLRNINLTTSAAATLGKSLSKMTYLRRLQLTGPDDRDCHGSFLNLNTLFEGFNDVRHLEELYLSNLSVVDSFAPLTEKFRFFADLKKLVLEDVNLDGDGLCLLLEGSRFIPNLQHLNLSFNPLGSAVRVIASYLDKLPELRELLIYRDFGYHSDLKYVWTAAQELRPEISVLWDLRNRDTL